MSWRTHDDSELKQFGYSIIIFRAIEAAGGIHKVAEHFGLTSAGIRLWYNTRWIPESKIEQLCSLGKFKFSVEQVKRESEKRKRLFDGK